MPYSLAFTLLMEGNVLGALQWIYSNYIPYGLFYVLIGIMVFGISYSKSRSYAIGGMVLTLFCTMIGALIPQELQNMLLLIIITMAAVLLIRVFK